jgi:arylsulfatase A-like enzyme
VRRGATIDFPATSPDLCATVLDAAGHTPPADIDGMSLVPLLGGRVLDSDRPLFWHYPHYGNQGGEPGAAVRVGDWKLIEWFHGPRIELFHLNDDPGETADCAAAQPDRVAALRDVLHAWQRETRAVTPTINGAFAPASTPSAHAIRE